MFGSPTRARTWDLRINSPSLYQLSYRGFETPTSMSPEKLEGAWPSRTIQIVVPYTPGTGADILARILGPKLAERWKVAVVTDNRAGASGNIGTDFVAKSAPDGYTLLCTATSFGTNPAINPKLPFDPIKSFAPIILLATSTMAVIVTQGF